MEKNGLIEKHIGDKSYIVKYKNIEDFSEKCFHYNYITNFKFPEYSKFFSVKAIDFYIFCRTLIGDKTHQRGVNWHYDFLIPDEEFYHLIEDIKIVKVPK